MQNLLPLKSCEAAMAEFTARQKVLGYAEAVIRRDVQYLYRANRWLAKRNRTLLDIQYSDTKQLISQMYAGYSQAHIGVLRQAFQHWFGVPHASRTKTPVRGKWECWLSDYAGFMSNHRGLKPETVQYNISEVRRFLSKVFGAGKPNWQSLCVEDIWDYCMNRVRGAKPGYANSRLFMLRRFLQYVNSRGCCVAQLSHAVPHVASFATTPSAPITLTALQQRRFRAAFPKQPIWQSVSHSFEILLGFVSHTIHALRSHPTDCLDLLPGAPDRTSTRWHKSGNSSIMHDNSNHGLHLCVHSHTRR